MRLTYIYHSGFAIETEGYAILIDYFQDTGKTPDTGFVHDASPSRYIIYIIVTFPSRPFQPGNTRMEKDKKGYQVYILQRHTEKAQG